MGWLQGPNGSTPGAAAQGPGPSALDYLSQFHNYLSKATNGALGAAVPTYDPKASNAAPGFSWQDIAAKAAADAAKAKQPKR